MERITQIAACASRMFLVIFVALLCVPARAQTPASAPQTSTPSAPATFSGCVQKEQGSPDNLVISTSNVCARLTGKAAAAKLAGHQVDLTGVLIPRTSSVAASIQVKSVSKVAAACSETCALQPPGTRGLHPSKKGEVPGSEGGTPGVAPQPKQ